MLSIKKARAAHLRVGRRGEKKAAELLKTKHYDVLARNYKTSVGEIDLIARDGAILVFIEVKTRMETTRSRPSEGLSERQQKRIYRTAHRYIKEIDSPKTVIRFDLIEIIFRRSYGVKEARHWLNHFSKQTLFPRFMD